jgi:hypothetical protein
MKLSDDVTPMVGRAQRATLALAAGVLLGFVVGQFVTPSSTERLMIGLLFSAIVYRTRSYSAVVIIPVAAIAVTSAVLQVVGLAISYRITFVWLAAGLLLVTAAILWVWESSSEKEVRVSDVLLLVIVAMIFQFLARQSTWDAKDALAAISLTGEDNGTWLNGVSAVLRRDATFDSAGITLGGSSATITASLLVGLANALGFRDGTFADSALITFQMYWLLTGLSAIFAARITYLLCAPHIGRLAVVPSSLATVALLPFAEGFINAGHLTALFAATFLISGILVLLEKPVSETVTCLLSVLLLFASADAWWPMRGVAVLALGTASLVLVSKLSTKRVHYAHALRSAVTNRGWKSTSVWGSGIAIGVVVLVLSRYIYQLVGTSPLESFRHLVGLLGADGGKADVDPLLVVIIFFFAIFASSSSCFQPCSLRMGSFSRRMRRNMRHIKLST